MTDLILTINSDDEVDYEVEESDEEEEITVVTKKQRDQKKNEAKLFNPKFKFEVENAGLYSSSTISDAIQAAMKKRKPRTTVEEKIVEHRAKLSETAKDDNASVGVETKPEVKVIQVKDDQDDIIEEDEELQEVITDTLRVKQKKGKKAEEDVNEGAIPLAKVEDSAAANKHISWNPDITFNDMNLSRPLLKAISAMNYVTPTPIQQAAIPISLMGRDVCACAATGTGKTAAFMLPVLERLINRPASQAITRVLCLLPTRELAVQVFTVAKQLSQHTNIRVCLAAGGMDVKSQEAALRTSPDIVIATPGRLIDHLHNAPSFTLATIEILILDEADRMLDEYFEDQMKEIIRMCSQQRQTMLFSATLSEEVESLVAVSLKKPVRIFVNSNTDVAPFLRQEFIRVRENKEGDREAIVTALCCRSFLTNVLIFAQTKKQAHRMHIILALLGIKAAELHGDLSQGERLKSLERFKTGDADVLVCTDLASRGLDINNVKTVINLTMPNTQQHYVHRVGRTARAGKTGRSVSLVGESERKLLKQIVKFAKTPVKSRVVPGEVIDKYRVKLEALEWEIGEIIKMELNEKRIVSTENQVNRAEKMLMGEQSEKRAWFQKSHERRMGKVERMLGAHSAVKGSKKGRNQDKKGNASKPSTADERMQVELEKSQQYRRRIEKRNKKPKRARACAEDEQPAAKKAKKQVKKKGFFDSELTNTSQKSVKKFRHINKFNKTGGKPGGGQNSKFNKGKGKKR